MSDEASASGAHDAGAAFDASAPASARDTERGASSAQSTRPPSASLHHSASAGLMQQQQQAPQRRVIEEPTGPASDASRAAAQEAQAAVLKDGTGGGSVPAAPVGLHNFAQQGGAGGVNAPNSSPPGAPVAAGTAAATIGLGVAHLQATMFGLGTEPVMEPTARVTVPRLDDMLLKALADNYHCQWDSDAVHGMSSGCSGAAQDPTLNAARELILLLLRACFCVPDALSLIVCPAFDWIPPEYLDNVVGLLAPGKLDFVTAAALIQTEKYWARMARERWGPKVPAAGAASPLGGPPLASSKSGSQAQQESLDLALHGHSWKRLYCEKHLTECLEKYHHSKQQHNYKRLLREVEACRPYVHTLVLRELSSHVDLGDLLYDFPHLSSATIKWGSRKVGMDFDRSLFGCTLADAMGLAKLLASGAGTLTHLSLRENLLGDEAVSLLMAGLHPSVCGANRSLTSLDLSHNKITDIGARKLAALLDGGASQAKDASRTAAENFDVGTTLIELDLSDNHLGALSGNFFGAALANNRGLRKLDLSLNNLGDEGGAALLSGGTQHTSLRELKVSSADLGPESGEQLLNLLRFNRSLDSLHLSCNPGLLESSGGGDAAGSAVLTALRANEQIVVLDLRRNGVAPKIEEEIKTLLAKRLARVKQAARKAYEKEWDAAM